MHITFRPIDHWPGEPTRPSARRRSPFSAGYSDTLQLLERELRAVQARDVVVQIDADESQIRRDGLPRSDARVHGPGVIVSCTARSGALSFPCDRFDRWADNLRAIALALEALRKVDRYGVTRAGEQYTGWRKLEAPGAALAGMSVEDAARLLSLAGGGNVRGLQESADLARRSHKLAAAKHHPDAVGGDAETLKRVQQAWEVLRRHHGL